MKPTNPDLDALLLYLANLKADERSALGRIVTAGQLADVQELERLYALPVVEDQGEISEADRFKNRLPTEPGNVGERQ